MKNKGFTLVELLAMLVVLGVLMTVAIPNIAGILNNQKKNNLKSDVTTMLETAKIKISKNSLMVKPQDGECIGFSLDYLNDNDNINLGPKGGSYEKYESFIIYARNKRTNTTEPVKYNYYVRLIEKYNTNKYFGIELDDVKNISETNNKNIKNIKNYTAYGLTKEGNNEAVLNNNADISSLCPNGVKKYYVRNN